MNVAADSNATQQNKKIEDMEKYMKPEIDVIEVAATTIMDGSTTFDGKISEDGTDSYLGKESGDDMSWSDESED